jgi:hypothetical protein
MPSVRRFLVRAPFAGALAFLAACDTTGPSGTARLGTLSLSPARVRAGDAVILRGEVLEASGCSEARYRVSYGILPIDDRLIAAGPSVQVDTLTADITDVVTVRLTCGGATDTRDVILSVAN